MVAQLCGVAERVFEVQDALKEIKQEDRFLKKRTKKKSRKKITFTLGAKMLLLLLSLTREFLDLIMPLLSLQRFVCLFLCVENL